MQRATLALRTLVHAGNYFREIGLLRQGPLEIARARLRRFGAAVRTARRREGLTQAELATQVGISRQYLSSAEQGKDRDVYKISS